MVDEKPNKYESHTSLPIPTYDEAISSRPSSSSQSYLGPEEISNDAERQGLLGQQDSVGRRPGGYQAPTVESARSSLESERFLSFSEDGSARISSEDPGREINQMEIIDHETDRGAARYLQMGRVISKRITSLRNTLSSFRLPLQLIFPRFSYLRNRTPGLPNWSQSNWLLIGRFIAIIFVMLLVYAVFASISFPMNRGSPGVGQMYDPESVKAYVQGHVNEDKIKSYLEYLTSYDKVAGTEGSYVSAQWVEGLFTAARLENVLMQRYDVHLNFPKSGGRRVAIIHPPEMVWAAIVEEERVYKNPTPQQKQTLAFHGHSRSGNVTGPLIYANYGSREDFKTLKASGVDVKGAIVLVRYYGSQGDRALKVKAAELAGAAGCIIYSDPAEDGFLKGTPWPEGRWRPSDGVQRGAVSLMSWVIGDVLTPGFASQPHSKFSDGHERLSKDQNPGLVNIPSLPLAWRDARKLLQSLKGYGQKVSESWIGGVPEVPEWWSGDKDSPVVRLVNEQDEIEDQPIYNVHGSITGLEQHDKVIYVGNHRDSWCFGAADPGSGTAVMLEVVRIFGTLRDLGWRPLRTISFASWDAGEYNLIGSTESVEHHIDEIRLNGIGYLNVDVGVAGSHFRASASPLLERALLRVLSLTIDPAENRTFRSLWDEKGSQLEGLGAGSDYVAFQDLAGCSSIDFGFTGPGYPYHSCYDNFEWMKRFGDPGFHYHKALAQIWALLILEIADKPILPYDMGAYASAVTGYVDQLEKHANNEKLRTQSKQAAEFNLTSLRKAADLFVTNAESFHKFEREWTELVYGGGGYESNVMAIKRMSHNTRMANFETHLLDLSENGGLPGREQFKHILFAPQKWSSYDEAFFPAIRDAIEADDWTLAQREVEKVADILAKASDKLLH
ncbi:MAG: hypothetical protein M1835_005847 [Candelina submexicana]|nr:MAG: hypothetical protein M1835_005847 [Candelina submexicana]